MLPAYLLSRLLVSDARFKHAWSRACPPGCFFLLISCIVRTLLVGLALVIVISAPSFATVLGIMGRFRYLSLPLSPFLPSSPSASPHPSLFLCPFLPIPPVPLSLPSSPSCPHPISRSFVSAPPCSAPTSSVIAWPHPIHSDLI